jgi:sentrin-specific protease 7
MRIIPDNLNAHNSDKFLNDKLIELKIKYMIDNLSFEKKSKVYAFGTLFYPKLTQESNPKVGHSLVSRWTKGINIFNFDIIFIPIVYSLHWSLVVIYKPSNWIESKFTNHEETFFLHLDSADYHNTDNVHKIITNYLSNEWKSKSDKEEQFKGNLFKNLPKLNSPCPKQENGYDCGVYLYKYVEVILDIFPNSKDLFSSLFNNNMFTKEDIGAERILYKNLIDQLGNDCVKLRKSNNIK